MEETRKNLPKRQNISEKAQEPDSHINCTQPEKECKNQPSNSPETKLNNEKQMVDKYQEEHDWPDLSQQVQQGVKLQIKKDRAQDRLNIQNLSQSSSNLQIIDDECSLSVKSLIYPLANQQSIKVDARHPMKNELFDASCSSINSQSKAIRKSPLQISQSFIHSQSEEKKTSQDSSLYYSSNFVSYDSMGIPKQEGIVIILPQIEKNLNEAALNSPFKTTIVKPNQKKNRLIEDSKRPDIDNGSLSYDQIITFEPVKKNMTIKKGQVENKSKSMKGQPISDPCFQKKSLNFYDNQDNQRPFTNPINQTSPYTCYHPYDMQRQHWNNQIYSNPLVCPHNTTYPTDSMNYLQHLPYNPINREVLRELPKPILGSKIQSEVDLKKEKIHMERPANLAGRICYPQVCISMSNCLLKLTACKLLRMRSDILLFPIIGSDFACYPSQFFKVTSPEFAYCTRRIPHFTEGECDLVQTKQQENFKIFAFLKLPTDKDRINGSFIKGVKNLLENYQSDNGELKSLIIPFCKAYGWSGKFLDSIFTFLEKGKEFKFKSITIICSHPSECLLLMQRFNSYFQYLVNQNLIVM